MKMKILSEIPNFLIALTLGYFLPRLVFVAYILMAIIGAALHYWLAIFLVPAAVIFLCLAAWEPLIEFINKHRIAGPNGTQSKSIDPRGWIPLTGFLLGLMLSILQSYVIESGAV